MYYQTGQIAQSVEQRTENPCVAGSIPALGTINQHKPRLVVNGSQVGILFSEL